MRVTRRSRLWVVYMVAVPGSTSRTGAVCEQGEWDAMQEAEPGRHALVRDGIASEAEAEALARDSSGYVAPGLKPSPYKLPDKPARRKKASAAGGAPKAGRA
jgi:hypothetical protein